MSKSANRENGARSVDQSELDARMESESHCVGLLKPPSSSSSVCMLCGSTAHTHQKDIAVVLVEEVMVEPEHIIISHPNMYMIILRVVLVAQTVEDR